MEIRAKYDEGDGDRAVARLRDGPLKRMHVRFKGVL